MHEDELESLLPRSFEMYEFMARHIERLKCFEPTSDIKFRMAFHSGLLSFEHGLSSLKLIAEGFMPSGFALMRPQYESLLRGFWLMYADTEVWLGRLAQAGTVGPNELKKLETPMITEMLKSLVNSEAPVHILDQLGKFRALNNSAFNSFTHSGLMALISTTKGYEPKLVYDALRNCNAVAAINLQMLSILTECEDGMEPVRTMHCQFIDCLPVLYNE